MIVDAKPGWTSEIPALPPGTIVALFSEDAEASIEGRLAGFKMVDTLLVLGPFTTRFAFMMRTPLSGGLVQSASDHNTGVLNIAASRTPDGRWPPNVVLVHHPACSEAAGDWQCVDACLVKHVDNLSGERKAGGAISTAKQGPAAGSYHGHGSGAAPWAGYGDHGSASRFYPQFSGDEGLLVWLSSLLSSPARTPRALGAST